jgi:hypothetical protein
MNPKILKATEESSLTEWCLPEIDYVITAEDIRFVAKHRPNLESLTLGFPDDEALEYLHLFTKLKKLCILESGCLSRKEEWVESICRECPEFCVNKS